MIRCETCGGTSFLVLSKTGERQVSGVPFHWGDCPELRP